MNGSANGPLSLSGSEPLEKELGKGAHLRLLADAEPHMPAYNRLTETIYGNFKQGAGLKV